MNAITINNKKYFLADDIISATPIWCKGVRNGRELIKKKSIISPNFIYARWTDDGWIESDGRSVKYDKVLIKNIFLKKVEEYINEINNENVCDDNGIEKAPEIIDLEDEEKFIDTDGWIIDIETRGTREHDKIFFKVKDIAYGFSISNLHQSLIDSRNGYEINNDYKYFLCNVEVSNMKKTSKNKVIKELFITYEGLIRVLYVSRSGNTKQFTSWATQKLFTLHLGTEKQKRKLVADVLGVDAQVVKDVFNKDARSLPCVYFFTLGCVKDLRKSMKISLDYNDDDVISIYGFTKDLSRRTKEHVAFCSKIKGVNLKLKLFSYVDPQYMSSAEKDIRLCMNTIDCHLEYKTEKEMVVVTKENMKFIKNHYESISAKYMGHISDMVSQLKEQESKYQMEMIIKDKMIAEEKHKNELMKEKYEHELLKKEMEIMKLKYNK